MRLFPWLTVPTLIACACSTTSIYQTPNSVQLPALPPEAPPTAKGALATEKNLEAYLAAQGGKGPALWLTRYAQGKAWLAENPEKACDYFLQAAQPSEFPLSRLARLRALATCPRQRLEAAPRLPAAAPAKDDLAPPTIAEALSFARDPWLRTLALKAALTQARELGNDLWERRIASDLARDERVASEKIALLQRALALAQKQGDVASAQDLKKRLEAFAPRLIENPPPEQWESVAVNLRNARQFEAAEDRFHAIIVGEFTDDEKFRAMDGLRSTFKLQRKLEPWLRETETRAAFALNRSRARRPSGLSHGREWLDLYLAAELDVARARWTQASRPDALRALDQLERELRGRRPLDDVLWLRARIAEEAGDFKEAIRLLTLAESSPAKTGAGLRAKIRWNRAWNLARVGDYSTAVKELDELLKTETGSGNGYRDRFWSARWTAAAGDPVESKKQLQLLIADDPLGYYGLLAHRELGQEFQPLAAAAVFPAGKSNASVFASPVEQNLFDWLAACDEKEIARALLDARALPKTSDDLEGWRALLSSYARAGAYGALFEKLAGAAPERRALLLAIEPQLLFPRPWSALAESSAQRNGVPSELIYAIMRQESSFNPSARSPADAFGLMQLLPTLAARLPARAEVGYADPTDLFRPEVNVPLGAAYLAELSARWRGQTALIAASYNASENAVQGWLRTRYRGDALAFIEDIPFDETRAYVKLVARNFIFYRRLAQPDRRVAFPEGLLDVDPRAFAAE